MSEIFYPKCYGLYSGGKDSAAMCQVLHEAGKLEACVALETGLNTPDWKEFIQRSCDQRGWAVEFYKTTSSYEEWILKWGFPGPRKHSWIMNILKGRGVQQFRKYRPGAILASGTRIYESGRRKMTAKPVSMWEGVPILAPILDWTTEEKWGFVNDHGFERAPGYATLRISGDCLCGAMAGEGEKEAIDFHYPEIGKYFDDLGEQIKDKHPKRCKWGWGANQPEGKKTAAEELICVECPRSRELFPETLPTVGLQTT